MGVQMADVVINNSVNKTGNFYVRRTWRNKCILQYEVKDSAGNSTWHDQPYLDKDAPLVLIATHTIGGKCCGL